jgi:hypothetical protein
MGWLTAPAAQAQDAPLVPGPAPAVLASSADTPPRPAVATPADQATSVDPAGCASCGPKAPDLPPMPKSGCGCKSEGCGDGCMSGNCYPGRKRCDHLGCSENYFGRVCEGLYECLCCPDPCYEPQWIPVANAAFFVDSARPVTQTRIRWDYGENLIFPDRNEYFWARAGSNQGNAGGGVNGVVQQVRQSAKIQGPDKVPLSVDYHEVSIYNEVGNNGFSAFGDFSFRGQAVDNADGTKFSTFGFGDLMIGTKSLFLDCELLQMAFQFKTFIPTGNFSKGLGTAHVSLEPSLLVTLRLSPVTYFQGQLSQWIPIAGNQDQAGALIHCHVAFNHLLYKSSKCQLISTAEFNTWKFQDGLYTQGVLGTNTALGVPSSGDTYASAGPGLRLQFCDNIDFGVGTAFALTSQHWAQQVVRTEFRLRY